MNVDHKNNVGLNSARERTQMTNSRQQDEMIGTFVGKVKHVCKNPSTGVFSYCFIGSPSPEYGDVFLAPREIEPWRDGFKEVEMHAIVKFDMYRTPRGYQARNAEVKREDLAAKVTDFQSAPDNLGNQRKDA